MPCLCCLQALKGGYDSVIVDTAGRLQIDDRLMGELQATKEAVKPTDTLLVVDAMTGQEAAGLVKAFNDAVELTGGLLLPRKILTAQLSGCCSSLQQPSTFRHVPPEINHCSGPGRQLSCPTSASELLQCPACGSPLTRTSVALQAPS